MATLRLLQKTTHTGTEKAFLPIARLVGVLGLRGELKCRLTSVGEGTIEVRREFFLSPLGERSVIVSKVRRHHQQCVLSLQGVESVEAARELVGMQLYLPREQIVLSQGEFLDDDIVGARLVDMQGLELGVVSGVEHYPAQDCLVVGPGRALVPLVKAFVQKIDIEQRRIIVTLPPGLLDQREAEEVPES